MSKANLGAASAALVAGFLVGCSGSGFTPAGALSLSPTLGQSGGSADGNPTNGGSGTGSNPGGGAGSDGSAGGSLGLCSVLPLQGVSWSAQLSVRERTLLALGLNISGSFEGESGWANLTNNFDGMGLSLGLLNQNFGTGSLQPLLLRFQKRQPTALQTLVSSAHLASLSAMLGRFEQSSGVIIANSPDESLDPISPLDEGQFDSGWEVRTESTTSDGVAWAKANLYTDGGVTFQPLWKRELNAIAVNPHYVSIQIEAAQVLHVKSLSYMKTLGLKETRSYLMMFDINVQNGGLYQADLDDYKIFFAHQPGASETTRLQKILELRLRHVRSQYVADVRSRKQSLINGTGPVHGAHRNYKQEYCFNDRQSAI